MTGVQTCALPISTLICSGQITREQALIELNKDLYPADSLKSDRDYVIKKLGLSESEFQSIMDTPPKSYTEYPNDEKKLKFIYSVYYKLIKR